MSESCAAFAARARWLGITPTGRRRRSFAESRLAAELFRRWSGVSTLFLGVLSSPRPGRGGNNLSVDDSAWISSLSSRCFLRVVNDHGELSGSGSRDGPSRINTFEGKRFLFALRSTSSAFAPVRWGGAECIRLIPRRETSLSSGSLSDSPPLVQSTDASDDPREGTGNAASSCTSSRGSSLLGAGAELTRSSGGVRDPVACMCEEVARSSEASVSTEAFRFLPNIPCK
mmetsp:Transcript_29262/g.77341  ORF Transcript_29262/g.77341 Transcript_29262/m.77341 type:complete len:229 (-) Transcript_29262:520-1206(-)